MNENNNVKTNIFIDYMCEMLNTLQSEAINEESIRKLGRKLNIICSDIVRLRELFRELNHYSVYIDEYNDVKASINEIIKKYVDLENKRSSSSGSASSDDLIEKNNDNFDNHEIVPEDVSDAEI